MLDILNEIIILFFDWFEVIFGLVIGYLLLRLFGNPRIEHLFELLKTFSAFMFQVLPIALAILFIVAVVLSMF